MLQEPNMDGERAPPDGLPQDDPFAPDADGEEHQPGIIGNCDKVEAFADDGTVLARAEQVAITEIKSILDNFANISGLKCNMDKSTIMLMGFEPGEAVPDWIANSGFQVVTKTTVLGCTIEANLNSLAGNFESVIQKIAKIKRFWERFDLSLPGRLNIAKSLMLSQLSYIGCFLDPTPPQTKKIKSLIEEFIRGRLNIAKDKIYLEASFGGVNMIDVDDFLVSIKCSWLKRIHNGIGDTYKEIFTKLACKDLKSINPNACKADTWPVLGCLWQAICNFYKSFVKVNNNWEAAPLLFHPLTQMGGGGVD
jgi:hypothetical protein